MKEKEIEIPYEDVENAIRANFDGFVFDDFMSELNKERGGGAGLPEKRKSELKEGEEEIDFNKFKRK